MTGSCVSCFIMNVSDPIERALKREIPLLAYLVLELRFPAGISSLWSAHPIRTSGATRVSYVESPCTYVYIESSLTIFVDMYHVKAQRC